jgi:hypothetical protein
MLFQNRLFRQTKAPRKPHQNFDLEKMDFEVPRLLLKLDLKYKQSIAINNNGIIILLKPDINYS